MDDRWAVVAESEARAGAGPAAQVLSVDSVTYVLGPVATVVFLDAGDRPAGSGVRSAEDVMLRAPFPDAVAERLNTGQRSSPPILGYVRLPEGCLPLGRLRISMARYVDESTDARWPWIGAQGPGQLVECRLHLDVRLPFDVLDRVCPTPPQALPDLDWLARLPHDPIAALGEFVAGWYADVPAPAGEPATSQLALPEPLLEFYRIAAGRQEVLGLHNEILPADAVRYEGPDGQVLFGAENQGCFLLMMDPSQPDPTVWYHGLAEDPVAEREPLSGFLLQFVLCEAAIAGPFGGFATIKHDQIPRFVEELRRVPLRPTRWPTDSTDYCVGHGVVAMISDCDDGMFEVCVGSRHRSALRPLREPGFTWQSFNG